jgi:hypothetical protein
MKMVEMLELREGLRKLGELPVPVKVADRIARALERVEAEGKHFEGLRQKLFEKHGKKDEKRGALVVPPEVQEAFGVEMNELLLLESELSVEPCVTIDELGDARIAPADLARCRRIIREA